MSIAHRTHFVLIALMLGGAPLAAQQTRVVHDPMMDDAAKSAWAFVDRNYVVATGFTKPFDQYSVSTMWDVAGGIAALHCARLLGFIPDAEYEARMRRTLQTLATMPLFEGKYFNKEYSTANGMMIGLSRRPSRHGYGASASDTGRLLTWLRIVHDTDPRFAADVERIIARVELDDYVDDGYLVGRQISRRTGRVRDFQEGRIGYEQYAARGFALWNVRAEDALDARRNAKPERIEGVEVPRDKRGGDRLTSEPYVLSGLETGWTSAVRAQALSVLEAQRRRYLRTKRPTAVSEDAINIAPDYFFYYTVYSKNGPWSIDVQRPRVEVTRPRWVSTKAAFAWYVLQPSAYTRMLAAHVANHARVAGVWGAGVFETGKPTGNANINTAAVVLEAAAYRTFGRPLIRVPVNAALAAR